MLFPASLQHKGGKDVVRPVEEKKYAFCCDHACRHTLFFGDVRFLGSYVAYALSKEREFYKV
jgi:hypothetical protein